MSIRDHSNYSKNRHRTIISSYRRGTNLSKIISFLGLLLILYLVYTNLKEDDSNIYLNQPESKENSDNIVASSEYELEISDLIFQGVNKNLYPYQINASQIVKIIDQKYLLENVDAKYKINGNQELLVNAKNGIFNQDSQILNLKNDVNILLSENRLLTQEARLNLANKEIFGNSGVLLIHKKSTISSDNFYSNDDNKIMKFNGRVSTMINLSDF